MTIFVPVSSFARSLLSIFYDDMNVDYIFSRAVTQRYEYANVSTGVNVLGVPNRLKFIHSFYFVQAALKQHIKPNNS